MITDRGFKTGFCSAADRTIFPDGYMIADFKCGLLTTEFQVLGCGPYYCARKDLAVVSYTRSIENAGIRSYAATITDDDVFFDRGEGSHLDITSDFRIAVDIIHDWVHSLQFVL